jgi:Flp pilus assembly protein protease CpaA
MNLFIAILVTLLLIWAAYVDLKTRLIPKGAGYGLLLIGLLVLLWNQLWVEAAYYVLAIWCTSGGIWRLVLILASAVTIFIRGEASIPLVLGILSVSAAFWARRFGGGDAQLAIGLIGVGHDWPILLFLLGATSVIGVIVVFHRLGFIAGINRFIVVFQKFLEKPDEDAVQSPWGGIALIAGTLYLWVWPIMNGGRLI